MKAAVVHVTPGRVAQEVLAPMPSHPTTPQRFWAKVNKNGPVPEYAPHLGNCWLWIGGEGDGYGRFSDGGRMVGAHRWAYEEAYGAIPIHLECDHLCRVTCCVRPSHLELVTHHENLRRGEGHGKETHCPQGHPYDEQNTYWVKFRTVGRACRACHREKERARYHQQHAEAALKEVRE